MLKSTYRSAAIVQRKNCTPVIRTGNFKFRPAQDVYLTNVSIEELDGTIIVHGNRRKFEYHDNGDDPMWHTDLRKGADNFCIDDDDWYVYTPGKVSRIFGGKPERRLKADWYMQKDGQTGVTYTFHGGLVEEHVE